jgi:hypothetical protein
LDIYGDALDAGCLGKCENFLSEHGNGNLDDAAGVLALERLKDQQIVGNGVRYFLGQNQVIVRLLGMRPSGGAVDDGGRRRLDPPSLLLI